MTRGLRNQKRAVRRTKNKVTDDQDEEGLDPSEMTKNGSTKAIFGSRLDPPSVFKDQYLFLMEFYVQHISGDRLAKLNQMFFVPTCVCFQFLDFNDEDIEVTPVDPFFQPQAGIADDIEYFYSGRSVMFAVDQNSVTKKILELVVRMTVRKRMPEDVKPDILVGVGEIDLTKQFAALRKEMLQCWHQSAPPPKVYEDEVPLTYNDAVTGSVNIYVRMSAFGQTIVTEFEAPESGGSSYVFKGDEMNEKKLVYKCRVIDSEAADVCKDSKEDIRVTSACRVCVAEGQPCSPCGRDAGATIRTDVDRRDVISKDLDTRTDTCADVAKHGLIQSSRGPPLPCGKAVVLKVSGLLGTGEDADKKKPTVTVASEAEATAPENPQDSQHDVFILRIGKKGLVGVGEKSDIQLEMRTPKGPERRPPIRYETREMQTEEDDKSKKDKKGKKKKKKK